MKELRHYNCRCRDFLNVNKGYIQPMKLTAEQFAAAQSRVNHTRIIAGPGTGKTATLSSRVVFLLEDLGLDPATLVALSFTRKASLELRDRVVKAVAARRGSAIADRVSRAAVFGTFHSFCYRILRAFGSKIGLREGFTILDEFDRRDVRKFVAERFGRENLEDNYFDHKLRINAVDLEDLLDLTLGLFDDFPAVAERMRAQFRHIVLDEFQDFDERQVKILELLRPAGTTVVGDPDQAIYGWRGASHRFLLQWDEHFGGDELVTHFLTRNFRSSKPIVDAASRLISHNKIRLDKPNETDRTGFPIKVNPAWISDIADDLLEWRTAGGDPDALAILARTNRIAEEVATALEERGLPVVRLMSHSSFWGAEPIRRLLVAARVAVNPAYSDGIRILLREGIFDELTLRDLPGLELEAIRAQTILAMKLSERSPTAAALFKLRDCFVDAEENLSAEAALGLVEETLDLASHYLDEGRTGKAGLVVEILEIAREWDTDEALSPGTSSIEAFLAWTALRDLQDRRKKTGFSVGTIHGAKGLEWDVVIAAGFAKGVLPSPRSDLEEERRIAYVALTRAKDHLTITRAPEEEDSPFIAEALDTAKVEEL